MPWDGVRINVTGAGGTGAPVIAEVAIYDTVGSGTNLITGSTGAITASVSQAVSSSKDGDAVFDNDLSTRWECGLTASVDTPQFVQGLFTNNITTIAEVGFSATITFSSLIERAPTDGTVELRDSDTGVWTEIGTFSGLTWVGGDEHRVTVSLSNNADAELTQTVDNFVINADAVATIAADATLTQTVDNFTLDADANGSPAKEVTLTQTVAPFTLNADAVTSNAPVNADATLNKTLGTFVLSSRTAKDVVRSLYVLVDNQGALYELTNFRPESDYPGGSPSVNMARGYGSLTMFVSSLDFLRTPQPWQWQGNIVATNNDDLDTKVRQLLTFIKRTVQVKRTSDNAFIDLYGVTDAIVVDPISQVRRDVTMALLPKSLAWSVPTSRAYGDGIYGEGLYVDNSGFEKIY